MNCIIVASLGRSGSTLLYKSILDIIGYGIGEEMFIENLNNCEYQKGAVYKTHDFPPDDAPGHAKFIWTFADPYEVVLSVLNQEMEAGVDWIKEHFNNLKGNFDRYNELVGYDAMRLEEHFDAWYGEQNSDLLTVKYRSIWDYQKQLSQFVGKYIDLPTFRDRNSRFELLDKGTKNTMRETYVDLHRKIKEAEDFKVW